MLNSFDKFALGQSNATISVAYNSYPYLLLIASFMKQGPDARSPHSVLFRVRVCMFPPIENTPLSLVCKVNTGQTLVREKYPFTGHFGNTNAGPDVSLIGVMEAPFSTLYP